uniref:Uncharacterized protein n=1 Tax=Schlesneria paludicola TaxID=360056 RepID=A0A7C2P593_9PLAN
MTVTITCPGCQSVHKVKEAYRGKKVRCPTQGCGRVWMVPEVVEPTPAAGPTAAVVDAPLSGGDGADTYRLAASVSDDEPSAPPPKRRSTRRALELTSAVPSAEQEVLLPDGRIRSMTRRDIRDALIAGKITRFSLMRSIHDEDGTVLEGLGSARDWKPIGFSVFIGPEKERPYYTKAARQGMSYRDDVSRISGIALYVLLMLGVGVVLYLLRWDFSGQHAALIAGFAVGGQTMYWGIRMGATGHLWTVILAFGGATYVVVLNFPEMSVAMAKTGLFVGAGLLAVGVAQGLGVLAGIAFDYAYRILNYDPNDKGPERQHREQAPYDGYPWMFWKSWKQKHLLRETLKRLQESQ